MAKQAPKLFRVGAAARELGLHPMTVRRWIKAGRIHVVQVGREVRIPRIEIERLVGSGEERLLVLYGRVSRQGQAEDLAQQVQTLERWADAHRTGRQILVLTDIGSGLTETRRQLQRLLKLVCEDRVFEIAITTADRLTRFGQDYLDTLFSCCGVTLTVLEPGEAGTLEQELTADLLTLMASLSGELYGLHSSKYQELMQCATATLSSP
jgi:putative resolvase